MYITKVIGVLWLHQLGKANLGGADGFWPLGHRDVRLLIVYIIIRPKAVDDEVPHHDSPNCERQGYVMAEWLVIWVGLRNTGENAIEDWFDVLEDGDTDEQPGGIYNNKLG